jgi:leucyl aminopeptidase
MFSGSTVAVEIFDEEELRTLKMGGLLAVGAGSVHSPRMVVLRYLPKDPPVKHIALVGKGITFDSGGISIKPSADMWEMKGDMSGAAVVAGAILAAERMNAPTQLTGVLALAENMPSGSALKPGDIITTASGRTIEVDNTDAEGRLVLADALHYACKQMPDEIIDLATLTGACLVALGEFTAGLFANNDDLSSALFSAGMQSYERLWRMPLWDDYNALIRSDVADVKNAGGKWGGAITAAKFLEQWVDKSIPWAHLDIAGPSSPHKHTNFSQPFFTGFGVRLLHKYFETLIAPEINERNVL